MTNFIKVLMVSDFGSILGGSYRGVFVSKVGNGEL